MVSAIVEFPIRRHVLNLLVSAAVHACSIPTVFVFMTTSLFYERNCTIKKWFFFFFRRAARLVHTFKSPCRAIAGSFHLVPRRHLTLVQFLICPTQKYRGRHSRLLISFDLRSRDYIRRFTRAPLGTVSYRLPTPRSNRVHECPVNPSPLRLFSALYPFHTRLAPHLVRFQYFHFDITHGLRFTSTCCDTPSAYLTGLVLIPRRVSFDVNNRFFFFFFLYVLPILCVVLFHGRFYGRKRFRTRDIPFRLLNLISELHTPAFIRVSIKQTKPVVIALFISIFFTFSAFH